MKGWVTCEDGGSGRWLYARPLDSASPAGAIVWVFICIDDMVDSCGRDADYYFNASVSVVDLLSIGVKAQEDALRSCDAQSWIHDLPTEKKWLSVAQCCHDYGAKSPCWEGTSPTINKEKDWQWNVPSDSSPTFTRLRAAARRFAEERLLDAESRNRLLDNRIVNKLGQTAREFANGTEGLWDALRRIKRSANATEEQKLILKMYQGAGQTLGAGPVPADIMKEEL
jgi:hypothetical protein